MTEANQKAATPTSQPRPLVQGGLLGAGVTVILALLLMVNYLSQRHFKRFDWTTGSLYTLSEKSLTVAKGITKDVDLVVLMNPGSQTFTAVNELLDRYVAANPDHLRKRELDPARNRLEFDQLVQSYGIQRDNVVVLAVRDASGGLVDKRIIDEYEMAEMDYSGAQFGQPPTMKEFKGEKMITSALLALVESKKPKILFTKGHGEISISAPRGDVALTAARDLLGRDNFELDEWSSLGQSSVPAGTDLVVIAGPRTHFLPPELETLGRYLDQGGHLLVLADLNFDPQGQVQAFDPALNAFLAKYGVEIGNDLVIDPANTLPTFGAETVFTASYGSHSIVQALQQTSTPVLMRVVRSVRVAANKPANAVVENLVLSSPESWAEKNLQDLLNAQPDADDTQGPIALGVAVTLGEGDKAGRLVVFGDAEFVSDEQISNVANGLMVVNTFNWLVSRTELIDIEGRQPEQTKLSLQPNEYYAVLILTALLPLLAIGTGIWVFFKRRR